MRMDCFCRHYPPLPATHVGQATREEPCQKSCFRASVLTASANTENLTSSLYLCRPSLRLHSSSVRLVLSWAPLPISTWLLQHVNFRGVGILIQHVSSEERPGRNSVSFWNLALGIMWKSFLPALPVAVGTQACRAQGQGMWTLSLADRVEILVEHMGEGECCCCLLKV